MLMPFPFYFSHTKNSHFIKYEWINLFYFIIAHTIYLSLDSPANNLVIYGEHYTWA